MPQEAGLLRLVVTAHESASDPSLWPRFLEHCAHAVGADITLFQRHHLSRRASQAIATFGMAQKFTDAYNQHYARLNVWRDNGARGYVKDRVVFDEQQYPRELLKRTEFYNDCLLPNRGTRSLAGVIDRRGETALVLTALRDEPREPFGTEQGRTLAFLLPHLARAFEAGERLQAVEAGERALTNLADPFFSGPLQIDVVFGGSLFIGGGASVLGGLAFAFNSSGIVGDGGSMTITGGASFSQGSSALMGDANSIDTLSCDGTSWVVDADHQSVIGSNTCPSSGPAGTQGPQGIQGTPGTQGPQGIQGAPGVSGREVVVSPLTQTVGKGATIAVAAACPAGKVVVGGGASTTNSSLALTAEGPSSATVWTVQFENITSKGQNATVTATAICAFAQ